MSEPIDTEEARRQLTEMIVEFFGTLRQYYSDVEFHAKVNTVVNHALMLDRLRSERVGEAERLREALQVALDAIAPCVVGWESVQQPPAWVEALWAAVNPIQAALGLPITDREGRAVLASSEEGNTDE